MLSQAHEEVAAATERAERARVAREELVQALAEEGAGGAGAVPVDAGAEAGPEEPVLWGARSLVHALTWAFSRGP